MVRTKVGVGLVGWFALGAAACGESSTPPSPSGDAGSEQGGTSTDAGSGTAGAVTQGGNASGGSASPNAGADAGGSGGAEQGGTAGTTSAGNAGTEQGGSAGTEQGGTAGTALGGNGGAAGGGGQGGTTEVDTTPPGALTLPADGSYNISTAFSCVDVTGVEPGASVYYELKTDGTAPGTPTPTSSKLGANAKLCGIPPNGPTKLRIVQYDAAGNGGPVTLHQYSLDTTAPEVCAATASPDDVAFAALPLHLRLGAEPAGTATVEIQNVGTATLKDDGTGGDVTAGDGIYELDYAIPAGADVPSATLTGRFVDAAGNPSTPYVLGKKLSVDRTATQVSGAIVVDTVWTAAASPYVITTDTAVAGDLTIEPGATVIFKGGSLLAVLGKLTALGTASKPIVMHDAWLSLDGEKDVSTFDPASGAYVTGSRLDYVQMSDGELVLENTNSAAAGAYITRSDIGTLTGGVPFRFTFGTYVATSHIRSIENGTMLLGGRIVNSHLGEVSLNGYSYLGMELRYNRIGVLEVDRWFDTAVMEHCDVGLLRLLRPTISGPMSFHANNLGAVGLPQAVVVVSGEASDPQVDATGNYWGAAATAQMVQLGTAANIGVIKDFFDDIKLPRVNYAGFLSAPVVAGPDWSLAVAPSKPDVSCDPGSGGTGGTGGFGGTGGTGSGGNSGGGVGGSGSSQVLGACNNTAAKYCNEYTGTLAQQAALQAECALSNLAWQSACADASLLGTCTYLHGSAQPRITGVLHYYQGAPATAAELKSACEAGLAGTWVTK